MNRETVIEKLRENRARLSSLGVVSASVFGSTARGEQDRDSDVDIAVRLSADFSRGGFDYFGKFEALRAELSELLGVDVDIVAEPARNPRIRAAIERDRLVAFQ